MADKTPKKKANEPIQDYLLRCTSALIDKGVDRREAFSRCAADFGVEFSAEAAHLNTTVAIRTAEECLKAGDGDPAKDPPPRTFLISAKTGDPIDRWYGRMVIDLKGIRTELKMPVLRSHNHDLVVGQGQGFKDGNHLYVEGEFSQATESAKEVLELADEGFPWQASIGIWAEEVLFVEAGNSRVVNGQKLDGPMDVWLKSFVRETSFVTLGADSKTAAIALTPDDGTAPPTTNSQEEENMDFAEFKEKHPDLFTEVRNEGIAAGVGQERARVTEILDAGADLVITTKVITDGIESGEAFKVFFMADKDLRAQNLADLESQSTNSQGQDSGNDDGSGTGEELTEFMAVAREIAKRDNVKMSVAMKKAVREDPESHKRFLIANQKPGLDDGRG